MSELLPVRSKGEDDNRRCWCSSFPSRIDFRAVHIPTQQGQGSSQGSGAGLVPTLSWAGLGRPKNPPAPHFIKIFKNWGWNILELPSWGRDFCSQLFLGELSGALQPFLMKHRQKYLFLCDFASPSHHFLGIFTAQGAPSPPKRWGLAWAADTGF